MQTRVIHFIQDHAAAEHFMMMQSSCPCWPGIWHFILESTQLIIANFEIFLFQQAHKSDF